MKQNKADRFLSMVVLTFVKQIFAFLFGLAVQGVQRLVNFSHCYLYMVKTGFQQEIQKSLYGNNACLCFLAKVPPTP